MTALLAATAAGVVRVERTAADGWSLERMLEADDVRCLAAGPDAVYAGADRTGIFRADGEGRRWRHAGLAGEAVRSLAVTGENVCAGTREPRVHLSDDGGARWRPLARFPRSRSWWWVQPAERPLRPSYVSALALTPEAIVAGIEACAVMRSTDGGRTWSGHRRGALRDCHELHVVGGQVYEAGSGGMAVSADGGRTWRRRREGLDRRYGWSLAVGGETLYLTAAPYRSAHGRNARACVFRARDSGAWERCTDELSTLPRLAATAAGEAFAALGDGTLLRSENQGRDWTRLPVSLGGSARALLTLE